MDRAATSLPSSAAITRASSPKRLNVFERYLSLWVGLCTVVGVVLGLTAPEDAGAAEPEVRSRQPDQRADRDLIWLMITPMMMKVDFGSIRNVGRRPRGLFVTLFVNWLVKPFSMAAIAWLFFRYVFSELLHDNVKKYGTVFNTVAPGTDLTGVFVRAQ